MRRLEILQLLAMGAALPQPPSALRTPIDSIDEQGPVVRSERRRVAERELSDNDRIAIARAAAKRDRKKYRWRMF